MKVRASIGSSGGGGSGETIQLYNNVTGDKTIQLSSIIPYYTELTADNFIIVIKSNGSATANDSTKTGTRYHDVYCGQITYDNTTGSLTITAPLVRTNGRSYNTVANNLNYDVYLMRTIGAT